MADGPCGILQLRKSDYIKMLGTDKVFLFNILNYSVIRQSAQHVIHLGDQGRLGGGALGHAGGLVVNAGATDVTLRYKQKDLCTLLGTQRTTLIATLDKLSQQEILDYDSNELQDP